MRVAILVTDDFEQSELTEPKKALEEAGATALIVAPTCLRAFQKGALGDVKRRLVRSFRQAEPVRIAP